MDYKLGGVSIKINPKKNAQVPKRMYFLPPNQVAEKVLACANVDIPVLLMGDTGTGKTSLIRYLARKTNNPLSRINLNGSTTIDEFVGKWLVNEKGTFWIDGVLLRAMRKGHWLILDEINASLPEILFILQSVLEPERSVVLSEKNGEIVKAHPNFRIFATANPSSDYAGTKDLNLATLSRFAVVNTDHLEQEKEKKVLKRHNSNINANIIKAMVEIANEARKAKKKGTITFPLSTRELIQWISLMKFVNSKKSFEMAILDKAQEFERTPLSDLYNLYYPKEVEPEPVKVKIKATTTEAITKEVVKHGSTDYK